MADPALSKGFLSVMGVKKTATAWSSGAAAVCGAGDGVEYTDEAIKNDSKLIEMEGIMGAAVPLAGIKGVELNAGSVSFPLYYQGLDVVLALALGTAGAPTQQAATLAYLHKWLAANEHNNLYATFAVGGGLVRAKEWPHVKIGGFEVSCESGKQAQLKIDGFADKLVINAAGVGTNNSTTLASVTLPTQRDPIVFSQLRCYVNATGGADFAAGDELYISSFSVKYDSKLQGDDVTTQFNFTPGEPHEDGFATISGSLKFSRWADNNHPLVAGGIAKTAYKMKLAFTGAVCATPYTYQFHIWLPNVQFNEVPNVGGPGLVSNELTFQGWRATAAPTGFPTSLTQGVGVTAMNLRATDALA